MPHETLPISTRQLARVVLFVSAGILGFEIALMRVLLVVSWHYFAFLIISLAMLGFGASGTALTILQARLRPRIGPVLYTLVLATAVAMAICVGLAQRFPLELRMVPAIWPAQLMQCLAHWALLSIPFFLGGAIIGLSLMTAAARTPIIYSCNLLGSAVGAALSLSLMHFVPPQWLCPLMSIPVFLGVPLQGIRKRRAALLMWATTGLVAVGFLTIVPPRLVADRYKFGAYVDQLVNQNLATRAGVALSPRAVVEAFRSETFHQLPFLTGGEAPPPLAILLTDGHYAGSVLDAKTQDDGCVVENTLPALAYALAPPDPRVTLLGETGGVNVWLAIRSKARSIDVVQPNAELVDIVRTALHDHGGTVLGLPSVRIAIAEPRHFVETSDQEFDLIQFVSLEGSAAGSHGLGGLGEERLFTVEGVVSAIRLLSPNGVLSITRGIQTPPRDNLKIFATVASALRRSGVRAPAEHLVVIRDFLAVCTIVKPTQWTTVQIERLRTLMRERSLTPVWFPGVRAEELNQPDALGGPLGESGDWYHVAARQLFGDSADEFIRDWPFDIRPPTDDRPYFLDFFKSGSFRQLRNCYGDLWLSRAELAFPLVVIAMVIVAGIGALLTLMPLAVMDGLRGLRGRRATAVYFGSIGLAYLLLEMMCMSRVTYWIGDPITAAAVTISTFLLMSGLGSMTAQYLPSRISARLLFGLLCVIAVVDMFVLTVGMTRVAAAGTALRVGASSLTIAPLAFLMGFPMPLALVRLQRGATKLVPWAWGINGFASVLAAPLAVALSMQFGFLLVGGVAVGFYALAGVIFASVPHPAWQSETRHSADAARVDARKSLGDGTCFNRPIL